ncbi:unknown [Prevotella sp. CAG:873]|nr:unknown [Prevotella sp. CAG:873]
MAPRQHRTRDTPSLQLPDVSQYRPVRQQPRCTRLRLQLLRHILHTFRAGALHRPQLRRNQRILGRIRPQRMDVERLHSLPIPARPQRHHHPQGLRPAAPEKQRQPHRHSQLHRRQPLQLAHAILHDHLQLQIQHLRQRQPTQRPQRR